MKKLYSLCLSACSVLAFVISSSCMPAASETAIPPDDKGVSASFSSSMKLDKTSLNSLAHTFHQIHVSTSKMHKSIQALVGEFNRTSLKILTYDEYINQYIDGKPVAYNEQLYPYGFQNIGNTSTTVGEPLPPRKEYVSHFLSETNGLLNLVQQEVDDSLEILNSKSTDLALNPMKKSLSDAKESLASKAKALSDLCKGEAFDKNAILSASSSLESALQELDTTCKLIFKMAAARRP